MRPWGQWAFTGGRRASPWSLLCAVPCPGPATLLGLGRSSHLHVLEGPLGVGEEPGQSLCRKDSTCSEDNHEKVTEKIDPCHLASHGPWPNQLQHLLGRSLLSAKKAPQDHLLQTPGGLKNLSSLSVHRPRSGRGTGWTLSPRLRNRPVTSRPARPHQGSGLHPDRAEGPAADVPRLSHPSHCPVPRLALSSGQRRLLQISRERQAQKWSKALLETHSPPGPSQKPPRAGLDRPRVSHHVSSRKLTRVPSIG